MATSVQIVNIKAILSQEHSIYFRRPVKHRGQSLIESWFCSLCRGLLILAFQTDCGCRFCDLCLEEFDDKAEERECPGGAAVCGPFSRKSGEEWRRPKPDAAVRRDIARVEVECPNDCGAVPHAFDLMNHLKKACPYRCCRHCRKTSHRESFLEEHGDTTCKNCGEVVPQCRLISEHQNPLSPNFCSTFHGPCPFCQNEWLRVRDFQRHQLFCTKWPQRCNYEALNCSGDHADPTLATQVHVLCLMKEFKTHRFTGSYDMERIRSDTQESIAKSKALLEDEDNTRAVLQNNGFFEDINKVSEKCKEEQERTKATHDVFQSLTTADVFMQQPMSFPVAPFIWQIPNYLVLKRHENVIDSKPFLSDHYGYKMRVRLYLNGDGQGRGTHLSAYIILMGYDYDNLQKWPFQHPFLFTLIDQGDKGQDYQQLIHPNPKSRSFARPPRTEGDSTTVRASGCAKFFPLERLTSNCTYLKDGNLYIRIDVRPKFS